MSKRKSHRAPAAPAESSAAEFVTVAWMLTTLLCLVCEIGSVAIAAWARSVQPPSQPLVALALVGFISATIMGVVALALTPVVLRIRRQRPPTTITVGACLIGAAPLVVLLVGWVSRM